MTTPLPGTDRTVSRAIEVGMVVARNQERSHLSREIMRLAMALHDRARFDAAAVLVAVTALIDGTADWSEVLDIITQVNSPKAVSDLPEEWPIS